MRAMSDFINKIKSLRKKRGSQESVGYTIREYWQGQKIISSIECKKSYFYKPEYIDKYLQKIAQTRKELNDLRQEYRKAILEEGWNLT